MDVHSPVDAAALGDDLLVVEPVEEGRRSISQTAGGEHEQLLVTRPLLDSAGEALVVDGDRWWFGKHGRGGVLFAAGQSGAVAQTWTPLAREEPILWLPVRGDEPRSVVISVSSDQRSLFVDEVTPAGVKARGTIEKRISGLIPSRRHWSAERLPDGRIVLVAIEERDDERRRNVMLRVFDQERVAETSLACGDASHDLLSTAMGSDGTLALVGMSTKREVVAMTVRPDTPRETVCRVISAPGEIVAKPLTPGGTTSIIATGGRFIAAWIRQDGGVRARELESAEIIDVGAGAETDRPLPRIVRGGDGVLTFLWLDRRGRLIRRRLCPGIYSRNP